MKHQEVIFSVTGQSLFFDAPEGRPSSVTSCTVYEASADDDGATEAATTGSATVETNPNTTVDAASGDGQADPTNVALTATTGIVRGRRYLLTNTFGELEWVEAKDITAADSIRVRVPLRNAYATSSTFQSTRMTIALDSTWAADRNNISDWCVGHPGYRVRWVYVVGGVTYAHASYFVLVRYPLQQLVSPLDVDGRFPGWIDRLPTDYQEDQGASLIQQALEDVRDDARGDSKILRRVRDTEVLAKLVAYRANLLGVELEVLRGAVDAAPRLELAEKLWRQRYDQLLREPKVQIDAGEGGTASVARRSPAWRR